jgi:hypothetical protein
MTLLGEPNMTAQLTLAQHARTLSTIKIFRDRHQHEHGKIGIRRIAILKTLRSGKMLVTVALAMQYAVVATRGNPALTMNANAAVQACSLHAQNVAAWL